MKISTRLSLAAPRQLRLPQLAARLVAAFLCVASSAGAGQSVTPVTSISVNFVGGQYNPGGSVVTGTAGVVPDSQWNNQVNESGTNIALHDSANAPAGTLTYSSNNYWAATDTTPAGGGDATMMNGQLDNFDYNHGIIIVSGLGTTFPAGYDVIVYQNADSAGSWGYTVTDDAGHTGTQYGRQLVRDGGNYPLAGGTNGYIRGRATNPAGAGTASNYVRITGLTGSSFTLTANRGTTGDGRVRPNGFQIVPTVVEQDPVQSGPTYTVNVTNDNDEVCTIDDCSLREAIDAANNDGVASTINFDATTFAAPRKTITLGSGLTITNNGTFTITGPTAGVTVDGVDQSFDILTVSSNATCTASGLTLINGSSGLNNSGTATVTNCTLNGNGYSLANASGTVTVTNCTLSGNYDGIYNDSGRAIVTNCTLNGNDSGLYNNSGTATVTNCTMSGNNNGLLDFAGNPTLTNCTLSGNHTGLYISVGVSLAKVTNCTLSGNIDFGLYNSSATKVNNSLIVGNGTNIGRFALYQSANNITSGTAAQAGLETTDGNNAVVLNDNGGPTKTIALLAGSPAINAGDNSLAKDAGGATLTTDQRGQTRIQGGRVDIGSFEFPNNAPTVVSVTHPDGSNVGSSNVGEAHTLTATYSDGDGGANVRLCYLIVNGSLKTAGSATVLYDAGTNKLYLVGDNGTYGNGAFLGSNTVLQNSQASLNCAQTTVSVVGNTRVVAWSLTPKAGFGGVKNLYLLAQDSVGASSGWSDLGDWSLPNNTPSVVSVTHPTGSNVGSSNVGEAHTLTATYSDGDGASTLRSCYLLVNSALTTGSGATLLYDAAFNKVYLRLDSGAWSAGATPGDAIVLENSSVSLNVAQTSVTPQGTNLVIAWSLTPKIGFGGVKNLYLYAQDNAGANSGWSDLGDWSLPNSAPTVVSVTHPDGSSEGSSAVGASHLLTATSSDADGGGNIRFCYLIVNATLKHTGATLLYDTLTNKLYLRLDSGAWSAAVTPGSATVLENAQMSLDCSQTTTQVVGNTRVVAWSLTPKAGFVGTKNLYLYAQDKNGLTAGWSDLGDWTITAPSADRPASTRATRSSTHTF